MMTHPNAALMGAIELGGTKINVASGSGPGAVVARTIIPTTTPSETLGAVIAFLRAQPPLAAIGIGSFGPVCLDPTRAEWGNITTTTKPGWSHTPVARMIADAIGVPIAFDTDVNAAALGEYRWGALADCASALYLTVGTGVGGGVLIDGRPLHGLTHPELGHIHVRRIPGDTFAGSCRFHGDCVEGLASGPAIAARLGCSLSDIDVADARCVPIFDALGQALATYVYTLSPHRVVIGGGVAKAPGFHAAVRSSFQRWLGGYGAAPALIREDYIVAPALGDDAGIMGAIALAQDLERHS